MLSQGLLSNSSSLNWSKRAAAKRTMAKIFRTAQLQNASGIQQWDTMYYSFKQSLSLISLSWENNPIFLTIFRAHYLSILTRTCLISLLVLRLFHICLVNWLCSIISIFNLQSLEMEEPTSIVLLKFTPLVLEELSPWLPSLALIRYKWKHCLAS